MLTLRIVRFFTLIITLYLLLPQLASAEDNDKPIVLRTWQIQWIPDDAAALTATRPEKGSWQESGSTRPATSVPADNRGMWVRIHVPPTESWKRPGLLIDRLYGLELSVYEDGRLLYESKRSFPVDINKLLMYVNSSSMDRELDLRIVTTSKRAGIISGIRIGDFHELSDRFVIRELPDLLLGTSIAFLALIMLICSGYLRRNQRSSWIALCLIALTSGSLIVMYSPLPYIYFEPQGSLMLRLFDLSLFVLLPALNSYIDQVFEGQYRFFTRFRKAQAFYSLFCAACLLIYVSDMKRFYEMYYLVSTVIMGAFILVQLLLIITLTLANAIKGNKNALILSIGILLLALSGIVDLVLYYLSDRGYVLFLWKFGVVIMIVALVIILARRVSADYAKLISYSKDLELYNHRLQRTEKLKIISDLAASVAHEVRNPLQVTRGFLQLLASRTDVKDKPYFELATNELDRAAEIITDFLTFAKPELEKAELLDLTQEIRKIEGIMVPMAAMHGSTLTCYSDDNLSILGNSSKLKQALINMIKNSIEAIGKDGSIEVWAVAEGREAVVRIKDDGQGMEDDEVAKLGVPFFSTKTKGTGLGLMVTYRIIEVMKGTIKVRSAKGKGTEFIIRFPLAEQDIVLPHEIRA